jgi:eukaryotic-like serine/threonine-protein kinase
MSSLGGTIAHYRLVAKIGQGGMGEVYRATDTKLGRDVALKVLPEVFAQDPDRMARFSREAHVLASLNHPNIAAIYGVEDRTLIMELVEGESLQGPLPLETAIKYALQIIDALEYAHEKGVVHRDLKPANIKVTPDGLVKVLDFGLAKIMDDTEQARDPASSPTITMRATQTGILMGTPGYMSPEQVRGKPADKRADIWAFGVVFAEMLSGKRLFDGDTVTEILASVMKDEPVFADAPPHIQHLLRRCVERDVRTRLRDIGEARILLENPSTALPQSRSTTRRAFHALPWAVATVCTLVSLFVAISYLREASPEMQTLKLDLAPPGNARFGAMALSPDGRFLAFVATESGKRLLWTRAIDSQRAQPLSGTEGAAYAFWSPDSRFIGFFAQGKLKKIAPSGSMLQTICDAPDGRGGSWSKDGVIIFSPTSALDTSLWQVSAAGGPAKPLTKLDPSRAENSHRWPCFLPDGRHYLYFRRSPLREHRGIYLGALDSVDSKRLLSADSNIAYAATNHQTGYVLFVRDDMLLAQPFNLQRLELLGDPLIVAEDVGYDPVFAWASFSVSDNNILVHSSRPGADIVKDQLIWFDRTGKRLKTISSQGLHYRPSISPDENRIAVDKIFDASATSDIWLIDLARDIPTRFTLNPQSEFHPVWSRDGSRIAFASFREDGGLFVKNSNGQGTEQQLTKAPNYQIPTDWSPDGRLLVYQEQKKQHWDIWLVPVTDPKPTPLFNTESNERWAQFSADGRWIAYVSDESSKDEVYVESFPPTGGKLRISNNGGSHPKWRRDGKELFYLSADKKIMAVEVRTGSAFQPAAPTALFQTQLPHMNARFAVTADGQRFLVPTAVGEDTPAAASVLINWRSGLRRQ